MKGEYCPNCSQPYPGLLIEHLTDGSRSDRQRVQNAGQGLETYAGINRDTQWYGSAQTQYQNVAQRSLSAAQASQGAALRKCPSGCGRLIGEGKGSCGDMYCVGRALEAENARLRKELEEARDGIREAHAQVHPRVRALELQNQQLVEALSKREALKSPPMIVVEPCDHEATIAKLKDREKTLVENCQKLEAAYADRGAELFGVRERLKDADVLNGRLTREIEKLKRGKR